MNKNVYPYLASQEDEAEQVQRFDRIFDTISVDSQAEITKYLKQLKNSIPHLGDVGAKFLFMRIHDYLKLSEQFRKSAQDYGVFLARMQ